MKLTLYLEPRICSYCNSNLNGIIKVLLLNQISLLQGGKSLYIFSHYFLSVTRAKNVNSNNTKLCKNSPIIFPSF